MPKIGKIRPCLNSLPSNIWSICVGSMIEIKCPVPSLTATFNSHPLGLIAINSPSDDSSKLLQPSFVMISR